MPNSMSFPFSRRCMNFGDLMNDLATGGQQCTLGIGGITVTTDRKASGIVFT